MPFLQREQLPQLTGTPTLQGSTLRKEKSKTGRERDRERREPTTSTWEPTTTLGVHSELVTPYDLLELQVQRKPGAAALGTLLQTYSTCSFWGENFA